MEIGKQLKNLRTEFKLSQDDLAGKVYVSRQTISNWENDKNYPDVKSLLLISSLFNVTLDILIKGDIEEMKQQISTDDIKKFNQEGKIFSALLIASAVLPVPLAVLLGNIGWCIWGAIFMLCFYYAIKVENLKKSFDVQTYKEILSFVEGKHLDNNEKNQEQVKRPYQKILLAMGAAAITILAGVIMGFLLR